MLPPLAGLRAVLTVAALCSAVAGSSAAPPDDESGFDLAAFESTLVQADGWGDDAALFSARGPFFRAFWADAFNTGFKSTSQITSLINRAVTGHYNAIVVEVMAYHDKGTSGHGAYWNSAIVPKATDISGGIDPLAVLVSQAHAAGIEVHAWIVPLRVCSTWPPNGNSLVASHPEWLMVPQANIGGGPAKVDGVYVFDPGSPDAQEYLVGIVRELVTNYAIDGINLDYIRYTVTNAGYPASNDYTKSGLARFRELTGYSGTPAYSGVVAWNDFRRQTITELVRRLRAEIASITSNPRQPLRFTADLICFGTAPSNFASSDAYNLFQNWRYWLEQGYLDAGVPMNYKRDWDADQAAMYRSWIDAGIVWRYNRHLYCGQANYLNPKAYSIQQLQYCINAGADGTCNYSYVGTADENMDDNWETDWTWYSYVGANLFTTAVAPPTMPWRNSATATEGTLWGRVADPATDIPIDGANIQVGPAAPVQTDGNGYYVVTMLPAVSGGTAYNIIATKTGCSQIQVTGVVITPGGITQQDVPLCNSAPNAGDMNLDGLVNATDFTQFAYCMKGANYFWAEGHFCTRADIDGNRAIDMADFVNFQRVYTGPP